MRTVVPVHLDATTGDIKIGNTTYSGAPNSMHMLALKRQPNRSHLDAPDVIGHNTYTSADDANGFFNIAKAAVPDALVIVNAVGNYGFSISDLKDNFHNYGGPDLTGQPDNVPYIFIGSKGRLAESATERGYSNQNLDGYLVRDTNDNYKFIQLDYVSYDIDGAGNIKIGDKNYAIADAVTKVGNCNPTASNALHLVVVDRTTLDGPVYDNAYCGGAQTTFDSLADTLNGLGEGNLVFIGSNGAPMGIRNFGTDGDIRVVKLAQAVARLGGYYQTIVYMNVTDTYALVGIAPPSATVKTNRQLTRESSSVYPDNPKGELHGVLVRGGHGTWYRPLNADPSGVANLDMYALLAQPPVAFPNPATNDELTAFQQIAEKLCRRKTCNVRNQYADTNISMDVYFTELENMRSPDNKDCNDDTNAGLPFCVMRQQLLNELQYVLDIRAFYNNLNSLWLASGTTSILSMLSAHNDILATIPAPPSAPAPNLVNPIINFFLGLASFIPEVGPLFGIADTMFNFATLTTTDQNGDSTTALTTKVSQLQTQAIAQFQAQSGTTATQFDLIYQDWGKIQTLGTALAGAEPGDDWYWDDQATSQILQAMDIPISASYYQSLMPAVYGIGSYVPGCSDDIGDNLCRDNYWGSTPVYGQPIGYLAYWDTNTGCCHPFNESPGNPAAYQPYTYPGDPNNPYQDPNNGTTYTQGHNTILADGAWLGIALLSDPFQGNSVGYYDPPQQSVLAHLFTPRSQGGLGVYRPAFYEGWPFPRVTCKQSAIYANGGTVGCDWNVAAPSTETHGFGLIRVTHRVDKIEKVGSTVNVTMKVTNNGTVVVKGVEINNIALRALGGSGQAVLMGPVLPIKIGELAPTKSATVVLQIGIPPGLTKLSMTAEGSIDAGRLEPTRFSQAQVIFPQRVQ
jgi:hypothetical protein